MTVSWWWVFKILLRMRRSKRRCSMYQSFIVCVGAVSGGRHRFHAVWERVVKGLWVNVGSSQCLSGEPKISCARWKDCVVRSVRYDGRVSVACGGGGVASIGSTV